ncbi:MAG: SAVED domain-containing protein [Caldimicrobium sp.]|nr:SAVED domain-containing protein [Caldimicrobium sp.]
MFRFEGMEEEHFLVFLKEGLLDEYMEEITRIFSTFTPKIQFALINHLRAHRELVNLKNLAQGLGVNKQDAERIISGEAKYVNILLASKELPHGDTNIRLSKAIAIPNTSKIITNLSHLKKNLSIISSWLNFPFAVFFEDYFTGESFMLPLAMSLAVERIPENLLFTGKFNKKGEILEVEYLREKLEFARERGFRLVHPRNTKSLQALREALEKRHWEIPFYITSESERECEVFFRSFMEKVDLSQSEFFSHLELLFGLPKSDFCLITGQLKSPEDWKTTCIEFQQRIQKVRDFLSGNKVFHFGIRGASALAFALGVLFSHLDPFVLYHYQVIGGKADYHPVKVMNPREIKEICKEYYLLKVQTEGEGEDLIILLNFSHHELLGDVKRFVGNTGLAPTYLVLQTEHKGNLPIEAFLPLAKESASYMQQLRADRSFRSYHFFFSCPVPLAFMIGLAFGHYVDGWIYNYQKEGNTYDAVLEFKFLRKLREGNVRIT